MSDQTAGAVIDMENLARMVAEGYIGERTNGDGFRLYNYTQRCQFDWVWNPETLACRGLVLDKDGNVQSRPFPKFFNVEDHENGRVPALPLEPFVVQEKLDGSLIVASVKPNGTLLVTSRGSFDSPHAQRAAEMLAGQDFIAPGETWCMELIAPWNRIVVDYGDRDELVTLARFDTATGQELPPDGPLPVARTFDGLTDVAEVMARLGTLSPNDEGYVLRFESGQRAKAKGAEYKRLHKLLTGVTPRTIWEALAHGHGLAAIVDRVPDEFHRWASDVASDLAAQFDRISSEASARYAALASMPSRKEQALALRDFEHRAAVFRLLDGRDASDIIWKSIKPGPAKAFWHDDETIAIAAANGR